MKIAALPSLILMAFAGPAFAHMGHLGEVAGHAHWVAGAAIGLAGAIALWAGTRGRKDSDESAEAEDASESDEAAKA
ncbi:MAG: hypothetical protein OIF40_02465 [Mangrovicoccus sp.]|nr:hypothetical protein [Mangrovicoccus sp.]